MQMSQVSGWSERGKDSMPPLRGGSSRTKSWVLATAILGAASSATRSAPSTVPAEDIRRDATVAAVERVMPAVVNINTEEVVAIRDPFENIFRDFFGPYYQRRQPNTQYS